LRSFVRLTSVRPGFEASNVLTFRLSATQSSYPTDARAQLFFADVLDRIRALPGVTAVGATSVLPLTPPPGDWSFMIEGHPVPAPGEPGPVADWLVATPGYPEAMGMRLVAGRWFTATDVRGTPGVVVINQTTAHNYWPNASPIGARIRLGGMADSLYRSVIGVVADVRQNTLDAEPRAQMYLPHAQFPATLPDSVSGIARGLTVAIRSARPPASLTPEVRRVLRDADPNVPMAQVRTVDDVMRASTATPRFALAMVGAFALLALAIAGVGVYGVVAYLVALRTREIGVRVALGAQRRDVLRLVVGQGMAPALVGIAVGLAAAFVTRGVVGTLLYQVPATDGVTFLGAAALLAAVGLVACYLPARRASSVDPMVALRYE
jgi:predicted permease